MSAAIPEKMYWMGEDIETMPREKLIEIISQLGRDLDETRHLALSSIEMFRNLHRRAHGQGANE